MPIEDEESFEHNPNYVRRDQLLGISSQLWDFDVNRVERIESISLETLEILLAEKFIEPDESQDFSPSTSEFLEFMRIHPETYAHGYAISPYRDDYRVTIEGIYAKGYDNTCEIRKDFSPFCASADVLGVENAYLYSWWD
jgi:hypothetical protein